MTAPRPGCWNKQRPTAESTYLGQYGWEYDGGLSRIPLMMDIPHRMSTTCKYDKSASDPGCVGCHQVPAAPAA